MNTLVELPSHSLYKNATNCKLSSFFETKGYLDNRRNFEPLSHASMSHDFMK